MRPFDFYGVQEDVIGHRYSHDLVLLYNLAFNNNQCLYSPEDRMEDWH